MTTSQRHVHHAVGAAGVRAEAPALSRAGRRLPSRAGAPTLNGLRHPCHRREWAQAPQHSHPPRSRRYWDS